MKKYGPETFGELNADEYDLLHNPGTTDAAIDLLSEFALPGRTLELAISNAHSRCNSTS